MVPAFLAWLWKLPPVVAGALGGIVSGILAGPLGVYALNAYRTRTRLHVRILDENFRDKDAVPTVRFEVTNSGADTSLRPRVILTGYRPRQGDRSRDWTFGPRQEWRFEVGHSDRKLAANTPTVLTATLVMEDVHGNLLPEDKRDVGFVWFKTYTFTPMRGRPKRLRLRSADLWPLSRLRFWVEFLRFRYRGNVELHPPGTLPP